MTMRVSARAFGAFGAIAVCATTVVAAVAAQSTSQGERTNFSIDPWHIFVPKPVSNPVTSVVEKIPGSNVTAEIPAQTEIVKDSIAYFDRCLKG